MILGLAAEGEIEEVSGLSDSCHVQILSLARCRRSPPADVPDGTRRLVAVLLLDTACGGRVAPVRCQRNAVRATDPVTARTSEGVARRVPLHSVVKSAPRPSSCA